MVDREEVLKHKLLKLEEQKNIYWRQRAKVHWLKDGDRNTHFFHKYASERRKSSRSNRLVEDGGRLVEREEEMLETVANYYKNLFTAHADGRVEELLHCVHPKVSNAMSDVLLNPFTEEEVKSALEAIGDLKSPGADGMTSLFYKKHWDIVGKDVTREVLHFLNGGAMLDKWNETVVALIPNGFYCMTKS
jgi:hypothetical protein